MQRCVARDAVGRSPYAMAVVDPSRAGGRPELGAGVEIVNDNALGRQLGVAGPRRALEQLAGRLPRGAVRLLPGIDVPFHSSHMAPAVAGLRAELERLVGAVDRSRLAGRWVPNLVGRPFSLDEEFVRAAGCEPGRRGSRRARPPARDRAARAPGGGARALGRHPACARLAARGGWLRRAPDRRVRPGRRARADRAHAHDARRARARRAGATAAARRGRPRRRAADGDGRRAVRGLRARRGRRGCGSLRARPGCGCLRARPGCGSLRAARGPCGRRRGGCGLGDRLRRRRCPAGRRRRPAPRARGPGARAPAAARRRRDARRPLPGRVVAAQPGPARPRPRARPVERRRGDPPADRRARRRAARGGRALPLPR